MSSNVIISDDRGNDLPTFYRKSNDAIALRPVEGSISMLARKVFNVMILHAQEQGQPGKVVPGDDPVFGSFYWLPLSEFTRSLEYESRDILTLKDVLEDMRRLKLVGENAHRWALAGLISSAIIVKASDSANKTGQAWIGYSFPPHLQNEILTPNEYTKFSLTYQSLMKSGATLALYEICRRFATNPSKVTYVRPVEFWYSAITGNPFSVKDFAYKYFKRDILKDAVAEINETTDIVVELVEFKTGRKISDLQFKVDMKRQSTFLFEDRAIIDSPVIDRIVKLGISRSAAYTIITDHTITVIEAALNEIERKIAEGNEENSTKIESVTQYFRWLLSHNQRMHGSADKSTEKQAVEKRSRAKRKTSKPVPQRIDAPISEAPEKKRKSGSTLINKFLADRAQKAVESYSLLGDSEQIELYDLFKKSNSLTGFNLDKGLTIVSNKKVFGLWYANHLWGEPTAVEIAEFAVNL